MKGIQKNLLRFPVPTASAVPYVSPVGRMIAGTGKTARIDKGLHQDRTNMITLLPVLRQTRKRQRQDPRGEILHLHRRQDQKTIIADQTAQVGSPSLLRPSDIMVSTLQGPRGRTEGQGPKISLGGTLHHISDLRTTQRPASQVMVSIQKSKPDLGFLGISAGYRINRNFAQLVQKATDFSDRRLNRIDRRAFKTKSFFWSRQIQNATLIQFGQRFPATHLLESAIGRPPIQPFAYPSRQIEPRNRWFCSDSLLNPIQ